MSYFIFSESQESHCPCALGISDSITWLMLIPWSGMPQSQDAICQITLIFQTQPGGYFLYETLKNSPIVGSSFLESTVMF